MVAMSVSQVHLILGEDEFLTERARRGILRSIGEHVEETSMRAGELTGPELIEVTSPSLFAEDRAIVLENTELAGKEPTELLLHAAGDPAPGIYLIIQHTGGGRNKSLVKNFKKVAQVHELPVLKYDNQQQDWITAELKSHNVRPTRDLVEALHSHVGSDPRELASAISQMVADNPGGITVDSVRTYHSGVAEVSSFDVADLAVAGETAEALSLTRRALQLGTSPVALAAALSSKVGTIARMYSSRGVDPKSLASTLGLHPFVVKKTAAVARRWSGDSVSEAVVLMAELDAAVKGQGGEPEFVIENAVRRVSELAG